MIEVVIHEGHSQKKPGAAAPALKPQGTKNKRTPQSFADGAAGKDVYEPEKVVAQRHREGRRDAVPGLLRCRQDVWRPLKICQR